MARPSAQRKMNAYGENSIAQQHARGIQDRPPQDACVDRLVVRRNQRISSILLKNVDWISSARNYVELHCADEVFRSRSTLAKVAALIPPLQFLRINRATIVNLESVELVNANSSGTIRIRIREGTEFSVSRRYSARVREVLEKLGKVQ